MIPNGMLASENDDPLGMSSQLAYVAMVLVEGYL